ncbi:hypothetical protein PICSAR15_04481 [Mycobacterium avium subsp. paratuberculosis]|nr:hypothetical protein PICSAR15_04481 [Mycobacterium avium subsp. paratuberculosis]
MKMIRPKDFSINSLVLGPDSPMKCPQKSDRRTSRISGWRTIPMPA